MFWRRGICEWLLSGSPSGSKNEEEDEFGVGIIEQLFIYLQSSNDVVSLALSRHEFGTRTFWMFPRLYDHPLAAEPAYMRGSVWLFRFFDTSRDSVKFRLRQPHPLAHGRWQGLF